LLAFVDLHVACLKLLKVLYSRGQRNFPPSEGLLVEDALWQNSRASLRDALAKLSYSPITKSHREKVS